LRTPPALPPHILPVEKYLSAVCLNQVEKNPEEGRFPSTITSDEAHHVPIFKNPGGYVERPFGTEGFGNAIEFNVHGL
jgi:hypothetical protein